MTGVTVPAAASLLHEEEKKIASEWVSGCREPEAETTPARPLICYDSKRSGKGSTARYTVIPFPAIRQRRRAA